MPGRKVSSHGGSEAPKMRRTRNSVSRDSRNNKETINSYSHLVDSCKPLFVRLTRLPISLVNKDTTESERKLKNRPVDNTNKPQPPRCHTPYGTRLQRLYKWDQNRIEYFSEDSDFGDEIDADVSELNTHVINKNQQSTEFKKNTTLLSQVEESASRDSDSIELIKDVKNDDDNSDNELEKIEVERITRSLRKRTRTSSITSIESLEVINSKPPKRLHLTEKIIDDNERAEEIARIPRPRTRLGDRMKERKKQLVIMVERLEDCNSPLIRKWQRQMRKHRSEAAVTSIENEIALRSRGSEMMKIAHDIVMCNEDDSEEDDDEIMEFLMAKRCGRSTENQNRRTTKTPVADSKQVNSRQTEKSSDDPSLHQKSNEEYLDGENENIQEISSDPTGFVTENNQEPEKSDKEAVDPLNIDDQETETENPENEKIFLEEYSDANNDVPSDTNSAVDSIVFSCTTPYIGNNEEIVARRKLIAMKNAMVVLTRATDSENCLINDEIHIPVNRSPKKTNTELDQVKSSSNNNNCSKDSEIESPKNTTEKSLEKENLSRERTISETSEMDQLVIDDDPLEKISEPEVELRLFYEESEDNVSSPADGSTDRILTDTDVNENPFSTKDTDNPEENGEGENTSESRETKCPKCDNVYENAESLNKHRKQGGACSLYNCKFCEVPIKTKYSLSRHERLCQNKLNKSPTKTPKPTKKPSTAKKTPVKPPNKRKLTSRSSSLECNVCALEFESKDALSDHLYKHSSEELQEAFKLAKAKAMSHLQKDKKKSNEESTETETDTETETETEKNSEPRVTVSNFLEAVASVPLAVCPCHRQADDASLVDSDLQIEMVLFCKLCSVIFRRQECLEVHYRESATCAMNRRERHPKLFCGNCQWSLNDWAEMRQHLEVHARENAERAIRFVCNICRVVFVGFGSLFYNHWIGHAKDSLFIAGKYNFPKHSLQPADGTEKLPAGAKPNENYLYVAEHVCANCNKPFSMRRDLELHHKSGNCPKYKPSYLLNCDACIRLFDTKEQFVEHAKTVHKKHFSCTTWLNDPRKFECTRCQEVFKSIKSIEEHWETEHRNIPIAILSPKNNPLTLNRKPVSDNNTTNVVSVESATSTVSVNSSMNVAVQTAVTAQDLQNTISSSSNSPNQFALLRAELSKNVEGEVNVSRLRQTIGSPINKNIPRAVPITINISDSEESRSEKSVEIKKKSPEKSNPAMSVSMEKETILKNCFTSDVAPDVSFEESRWKWWQSANAQKRQGFLRVKNLSELQAIKKHACSFCNAAFELENDMKEHARTHYVGNWPENQNQSRISAALVLPSPQEQSSASIVISGKAPLVSPNALVTVDISGNNYIVPQTVQVVPNEGGTEVISSLGIGRSSSTWIPLTVNQTSPHPSGNEFRISQVSTSCSNQEPIYTTPNQLGNNIYTPIITNLNSETGMHKGSLSLPAGYHILPPIVAMPTGSSQPAVSNVLPTTVLSSQLSSPYKVCTVCNLHFKDIESLNKHARSHYGTISAQQSKEVPTTIDTSKSVPNNQIRTNNTSNGPPSTNSDSQADKSKASNRVLLCAICKTSLYTSYNSLRSHAVLIHGISDIDLDKIALENYHCNRCPGITALFDSEDKYRDHVDSIHRHACTICKRIFSNFQNLRRHLQRCQNYSSLNPQENNV